MMRLGFMLLLTTSLAAQTPPDLARERSDYLAWLTAAPNSPLAAIAQQHVGAGVRVGPSDAEIPIPGFPPAKVFPSQGGFRVEDSVGVRPLAANRPIRLGRYTLYLTASSGDAVLTVFGPPVAHTTPGYFPYDPKWTFTGRLLPPKTRGNTRVLGPEGIEVQATEAGTVLVPIGGGGSLRVLRIPSGEEESDLEIYFRDESNGHGSYPAGRFVSLIPQPSGLYQLDFNRARNPFCAYSSVYPCPAPWAGNVLHAPIHAGERYAGGGLDSVPGRRTAP
jgi:hypothetical protein